MNNILEGIKNLYRFFWVVWRYRDWDYMFTLNLLSRGLQFNSDGGMLAKKVVTLINEMDNKDYIEIAEIELGQKYPIFKREFEKMPDGNFKMINNDEMNEEDILLADKIVKKSYEIEEREWNSIFDTLKNNMRNWWN